MFEVSNEEIIFYSIALSFVFLASIGASYSIYKDNKLKQHSAKKLAT